MNKLFIFLCCAAIAGVAAIPAQAQSIEQQDKIARYQSSEVKSATDLLNRRCGSTVAIKIDWASFAKEDWAKHNPMDRCLEPLSNIGMQCTSSAAFKSAFASKIQTYSCAEGTSGNNLFSISGSDFKLSVDWDAMKLGYTAVDYLQKNL